MLISNFSLTVHLFLCIPSVGPLSVVVYVHLEDANDIDFKK